MYMLRDSIGYLEIALPVALLLWFIYWLISRHAENHQNWHHTFDREQFSAEEFYASVTEHIIKRGIPDIELYRVSYKQGSSFGDDREYLHIKYHEYEYDVCAAPYGNCYFASLWYVERHSFLKKLLKMIPFLKKFLSFKTYYEMDTETVANNAVYTAFNEAIDGLKETQGFRLVPSSGIPIARK